LLVRSVTTSRTVLVASWGEAAEAAQAAMLQSRMWDPGKREERRINRDQSKRQGAVNASSIF
jgi:hypothetical protein